jgi:hypothetical protein
MAGLITASFTLKWNVATKRFYSQVLSELYQFGCKYNVYNKGSYSLYASSRRYQDVEHQEKATDIDNDWSKIEAIIVDLVDAERATLKLGYPFQDASPDVFVHYWCSSGRYANLSISTPDETLLPDERVNQKASTKNIEAFLGITKIFIKNAKPVYGRIDLEVPMPSYDELRTDGLPGVAWGNYLSTEITDKIGKKGIKKIIKRSAHWEYIDNMGLLFFVGELEFLGGPSPQDKFFNAIFRGLKLA